MRAACVRLITFTHSPCIFTSLNNIPNFIFCTDPNPCSCKGGGFEIFVPFCETESDGVNATNSTATMGENVSVARDTYVSLFDELGQDTSVVIVSIAVLLATGGVFALARLSISLTKANEREVILLENEARLIEANEQIQKELLDTRLNQKQV